MIIIAEKIEQKHIKTALKIYNYYIANSLSNLKKKMSTNTFNALYKKIKLLKLPS